MPIDDRTLVLIQEPSNPKSHPLVWLGIGTGIVVGALYFLRGKPGWSGGDTGLLEKIRERIAPSPTTPELPPILHDDVRLTFVMTSPTADAPQQPMSFRGPDALAYSMDGVVGRVKAGGRSDVTLKAAGSVRQGSWLSAKASLKAAGIDVWDTPGDSDKMVGSSRGIYR